MFDLFKLTATEFNEVPNMIIAQLRGWGDELDDDTAEPVDDAPFMQQLGVAVFPIVRSTLRGLGWRHGDEVWMLKVWDKARKLFDMEKGETRIYAVGNEATRLRLRANGHVAVDAEAISLGSAQGGVGVARIKDKIECGDIRYSQGVAPNVLAVSYTKSDGTVERVQISFSVVAGAVVVGVLEGQHSLAGTITSGSERVKTL